MVRSQRKTVGGESMDNGCGNRRKEQRVKGWGGRKSGMSGDGERGGAGRGVGEENEKQDS